MVRGINIGRDNLRRIALENSGCGANNSGHLPKVSRASGIAAKLRGKAVVNTQVDSRLSL